MINLNFKYSFVFFTYFILIILIILSYIAIVPEEDIPVLRNDKEIFKVIENKFIENENSVYEILEKKNQKKGIENIIEKEVFSESLEKEKQIKGHFRIQFVSFKDKKKSEKIAKQIKNEFFKDKDKPLLVKKVYLKSKQIFYRVLTNDLYEYNEAKKICNLVSKRFQCLIIKESE